MGVVLYRTNPLNDPLRERSFNLWDTGVGVVATAQDGVVVNGLGAGGGEIRLVQARCITAPTGAAQSYKVKKNGTNILSSDFPVVTFADGQSTGTSGVLAAGITVADGDLLTLDCAQIGSSTAGWYAAISVVVHIPDAVIEVHGDSPVTT